MNKTIGTVNIKLHGVNFQVSYTIYGENRPQTHEYPAEHEELDIDYISPEFTAQSSFVDFMESIDLLDIFKEAVNTSIKENKNDNNC